MIPGGMDPKKMQAMMRQMGIKSEEIPSSKVVIETETGALVIDNPQVVKITMQGQTSFQISGDAKREERISEEDIQMVMDQANCSEEQARAALEENEGDIR